MFDNTKDDSMTANERKMRHKFRNLQLCPELPNHLLVSSSLRVEQGDLGERVGDVKLRNEATTAADQHSPSGSA